MIETIRFDMQGNISNQTIKDITSLLNQGEIVALPTETVYGLGADARNEQAVRKIFRAKGRPSDNPLIVHVASKEQLYSLVAETPAYLEKLIDNFSPGPITYVLKSARALAPSVSAGLDTVGVRIPNHPVALAILEYSNIPLAAPSANQSGRPSPTTADHVAEDLTGKIAAIVDGGPTEVGLESTVLDCTGEVPVILRPGKITLEQIISVVGKCEIYEKNTEKQPKSPGLKYVHYAPKIPLLLVAQEMLAKVVDENRRANKRISLIYHSKSSRDIVAEKHIWLGEDEASISHRLYAALRESEKTNADLIICELSSNIAKNRAIMDRLQRAAIKIIR